VTRLFVIALAFVPFFSAQAQLPQYHAQVFGAAQGIGSGGISDIFKDRQQFLWIVNNNTLQRFDGRNVRTYPFERPLKQALCDRDNRIWALTGWQIWRNHTDKEGFGEIAFDTTGGSYPVALFQMPEQPIYLLTLKGLFAWQEKEGRFERQPGSPPRPLSYTNLWRFGTCGTTIFYHGGNGICAYDIVKNQARSLPFKGEVPYFQALTPDLLAVTNYNSQSFWYDFARGTVTQIDPRRYGVSTQGGAFGITGAAPLGNGRFLMTSRIGTFIYDLPNDRFSKEKIYAAGKPLDLEDLLMRVFIDENGTAWAHNVNDIAAFSSLGNTVGLLRNYHPEPPKAWSNRTLGVAEDDKGNLWFGGAGGFKKLNLSTGIVTPYPAVDGATDRLSHPSVRGMGYDGRYVIIGPTDKGVWLFDPKTERYRRPVYASDSVRRESERDFIDHLAVMRNGDIVVAGRFHPYRIEAGTYRMDFISFPGDNRNMNVVFQDKKGRIWLGSHGGVFCLDENYRLLSVHPMEVVFCLLEGENEDEVLVGTTKGLRRVALHPDGNRTYAVPAPLEGEGVTTLLRDSLRRLWLGSLSGLYLANPDLTIFKKFDFADNIQGLVFNGSSGLKAGNGMAFFGGINGINYFFPEKIAMDDRPLSVSVQSVRVNDRDSVAWWQPVAKFVVPFRQNTLNFEVVAPYFNNAGKVQYRYRLSGHSDDWVNIGVSNQIRLADLPPGDYLLDVAASITGNVWHQAQNALQFSVLPPFWQTWPFRLGVFAALGSLVFGLIRFRENRFRKQQQAQLELEKLQNANLLYQLKAAQAEEEKRRALLEAVENQRKAAEAKLQSMRLQMNPHFLFNALNSIQQMTLSGNGDGAAMYLSKFSKLLRMVLTHSDHEQVSLREEIAMLQLYLELESLRFDDTFEYSLRSCCDLDEDEYKVPPLLIQPFVENAIWHGLMHKEGSRSLKIYFDTTPGDRLRCTIEDNGIGRAAAQNFSRNGAHTGTAVRVGSERIETLNQQYGQNNTIEIIDLQDENGMPAGTRVLIEFD